MTIVIVMDTSDELRQEKTKNKLLLPLLLVSVVMLFAIGWIAWREVAYYNKPVGKPVEEEVVSISKETKQDIKGEQDEAPKSDIALSYDDQPYLNVKEWNVKIPITSSVRSLNYTVKTVNDGSQILSFSTDTTSCDGGSVLVMRGKAKDWLPSGTADRAAAFEDQYEDPTFGVGKRLGDYYFVSPLVPGASCGASETEQQQYLRARSSIVRALHNMVPLN